MTDLKGIACYQAERPININTKAEAKGGNVGNNKYAISGNGGISVAADTILDSSIKKNESGVSDELKAKLKELSEAVEAMAKEIPGNKAEEVTNDLQTLVNETTKKEPRQKWYELSAQGLIEAAQTVGTVGQPVIQTVQEVSKLLGI
ncbi:MAG: hypothetical protein GY749_23735 [Desulfobacteraceae bacterium]|nr:hypothetical protein [Desulfobacteraceae bacterium]